MSDKKDRPYYKHPAYGKKRDRELKEQIKTGIEVGKNKMIVDPEEVYKLAKLHATDTEISEYLEISRDVLKYNFKDELMKGRAETRNALRRKQIQVALSGNVTMLIWLGKNILEQSDRQETDKSIQDLTDLIRPIIVKESDKNEDK